MTEKIVNALSRRAERYSQLAEHWLKVAKENPSEENLNKVEKVNDDAQAALFITRLAIRDLKEGK